MSVRNSPLQPSEIRGVYTPIITPMRPGNGFDNQIDYNKFQKLVDDQVRAGVSGLVLIGTTGQSEALEPEEKVDFVGQAFDYVRTNHPQLQVIVGAGSNFTKRAIAISRAIEDRIGPSTFLHVTGAYNKPTQNGLKAHYMALAESIPKSNFLLYNVPGRVPVKASFETVRDIVERTKNVVGIKEASEDKTPNEIKKMVEGIDPKRFVCLCGEDKFVTQSIKVGARGTVSASANLAPRYFVKITEAALRGDFVEAQRLQDEINPLVKAVFRVTNPIPLAMLFNTGLRLPLIEEPDILQEISGIVGKYDPKDLGVDRMEYQ